MSAAVSSARAGTPADAILGAVPREVVSPSSVAEAAEAVAEAARGKAALAFAGGGTALSLGAPPRRLDVLLRTEKLDRLVEHAPSDQVVTAEAGMTLGALQRALAPDGQRLALDPPLADRATLGGLLATNGFGPLRARYGTLRDLLIGVTLVRADGALAKGGGKVVKNVAGFDLPKMAVGSLGTLGLIATATFRLHPLPERTTTLLVPARTAKEMRALVLALREAQLEPAAMAALTAEAGKFDLGIRFEGFAAGVADQLEKTRALTAHADILDEAGQRAFWERHDGARTAGPLRAKASVLPTQIEEFLEGKTGAGALLGSLGAPALAVYPTLGILYVSGSPTDDLEAARGLSSARAAAAARGGSLVLEEAPAGVRAAVDVWGPAPPAFFLMRRLKERLDPQGLLNPGRFVGGL
jgi:glycolate oxidase FAD binding subunit